MSALFPEVPKIQRPKAVKIYVFDYPTVVLTPSLQEPDSIPYSARIFGRSH